MEFWVTTLSGRPDQDRRLMTSRAAFRNRSRSWPISIRSPIGATPPLGQCCRDYVRVRARDRAQAAPAKPLAHAAEPLHVALEGSVGGLKGSEETGNVR